MFCAGCLEDDGGAMGFFVTSTVPDIISSV